MKKTERILAYCVVAISLITVILMSVSLEVKLSKLSEAEPVVIYIPETSQYPASAETIPTENATTSAYNSQAETTALHPATEVQTTQGSEAHTQTSGALCETMPTASDNTFTESTISPCEPDSFYSETQAEPTTRKAVSPENTELFVTKSGTKFHLAGCSYLSKSCIPITYEQALEKGFSPCSRCFSDIEE